MTNEEAQANLTKNEGHIYTIRTSEHYSIYAGITGEGQQVLMGLYCPGLVSIFFDSEGNLVTLKYKRLPWLPSNTLMVCDDRFLDDLFAWQKELTYKSRVIKVKKFFIFETNSKGFSRPRSARKIDARGKKFFGGKKFFIFETDSNNKVIDPSWTDGIGIVDFPYWFVDVLVTPQEFEKREKGFVNRWKQKDRFILHWTASGLFLERSGGIVERL
jgi:hypothetical protein